MPGDKKEQQRARWRMPMVAAFDRTALLFVDPNNDFLSGVASEMGWRLIDNLRTKLWNEEISK
jgi:hypothetical protein